MNIGKIKFFIPAILIALVIAYGSLTPSSDSSVMKLFNIKISDKIIHGFFYFLLTASIFYPIVHYNLNVDTNMILIFLFVFVYGILIELAQYYLIETREGELYDVLANAAGILAAYGIIKAYRLQLVKTQTIYKETKKRN